MARHSVAAPFIPAPAPHLTSPNVHLHQTPTTTHAHIFPRISTSESKHAYALDRPPSPICLLEVAASGASAPTTAINLGLAAAAVSAQTPTQVSQFISFRKPWRRNLQAVRSTMRTGTRSGVESFEQLSNLPPHIQASGPTRTLAAHSVNRIRVAASSAATIPQALPSEVEEVRRSFCASQSRHIFAFLSLYLDFAQTTAPFVNVLVFLRRRALFLAFLQATVMCLGLPLEFFLSVCFGCNSTADLSII